MMAKNTKKTAKAAGSKKNGEAAPKKNGEASTAKKGGATTQKGAEAPEPKSAPATTRRSPGQTVAPAELSALRGPVEGAKKLLEQVQAETDQVIAKAKERVAKAKGTYQEVLTPYRDACRKAKVKCEYEGGRSQNVSDKVTFLVEKVKEGIQVTVKGRPQTAETIPTATLKKSLNKAAYGYTDKHVGKRSEVGNKGGSLSNRLRAVLAK